MLDMSYEINNNPVYLFIYLYLIHRVFPVHPCRFQGKRTEICNIYYKHKHDLFELLSFTRLHLSGKQTKFRTYSNRFLVALSLGDKRRLLCSWCLVFLARKNFFLLKFRKVWINNDVGGGGGITSQVFTRSSNASKTNIELCNEQNLSIRNVHL